MSTTVCLLMHYNTYNIHVANAYVAVWSCTGMTQTLYAHLVYLCTCVLACLHCLAMSYVHIIRHYFVYMCAPDIYLSIQYNTHMHI